MISNQTDRWEYDGDGATTAFPYDNVIFAAANVDVYVDGVGPLVLDTDYTVTGAPGFTAGNIVFGTAPAAGDKNVVIQRNVPAQQGTTFPLGTAFPSQAVERAFDKLTVMVQQVKGALARCVQVGPAVTGILSLALPALQPGKFLRANSAGDNLEFATVQDAGSVVSASEAEEGIARQATDAEIEDAAEVNAFPRPDQLAAAIAASVAAAIAPLTQPVPCFRADKNGVDQTGVASITFTKITFANEVEDVGNHYDAANSRYTPAAGLYLFTANVLFSAGVQDQGEYFLALYKNGAIAYSGTTLRGSGTNYDAPDVTALDRASGTDVYEIYAFGRSSGTLTVQGVATNAYFQAVKVG
jgi:hypothetical protein